MPTFILGLYRSFAVQLLLLHLRSSVLLLLLWLVLIAFISGNLAFSFGAQYLFLDPEYLDQVNLWSFLIVGLCFGFFTMSWNLTTYLLSARYFSFLASLSRPFFKFCLNNALLPLFALCVYLMLLFQFNAPYETRSDWIRLFISICGLLGGLSLSLLIYACYFYFTNRDIAYYEPKLSAMPHLAPDELGRRRYRRSKSLNTLKSENPLGVRTYLGNGLKTRLVRSVSHYDRKLLERVFKQQHWNALILQFSTVLVLIILGLLIDYRLFQIPAAGSILILFSLIVAVIGAISYWAFRWRLIILFLVGFSINWITSTEWFSRSNFAYGLDYNAEYALYSEDRFEAYCHSDSYHADRKQGLGILENWRGRQVEDKPKLVIISASGGGQAAALWATMVLQKLEERLCEGLMGRTTLLTGASGGMLGMAYLREIYLRSLTEGGWSITDPDHRDAISKDLLNPIAFSIVSNDLFLPFTQVEVGGHYYYRDRAYSFEQKFNLNTGGILDHSLAYYREPEAQGLIPQMLLTPSIINDGRRLSISPQAGGHLMASPEAFKPTGTIPADAVDLGWLLGREQADSLRFLTALRMNATYPYVLPFVQLPTEPRIRVMDAGYRDNFGIISAARFLHVYKDWIVENTSGVLLVQISVELRDASLSQDPNEGVVESLVNPLGLVAGVLDVQSYEQGNTIGLVGDLLAPHPFEVVKFPYRTLDGNKLRESISFHLTERERSNIIGAISLPEYESRIDRVVRVLESN
ncbi:MAG: patatin-like phospholipase family protein [Bacteroidota bacterium]